MALEFPWPEVNRASHSVNSLGSASTVLVPIQDPTKEKRGWLEHVGSQLTQEGVKSLQSVVIRSILVLLG